MESHDSIYRTLNKPSVLIVGDGEDSEVLSVYKGGRLIDRAFNICNSLDFKLYTLYDATGLDLTKSIPDEIKILTQPHIEKFYLKLFTPTLAHKTDTLYNDNAYVAEYYNLYDLWRRLGFISLKKINPNKIQQFTSYFIITVMDRLMEQFKIGEVEWRSLRN